MIYLDTSVLVAYYCPEALSDVAEELIRGQPSPGISDLVEVELYSAVARKVREGEMARDEGRRVSAIFLEHLEAQLFARVPVERPHFVAARSFLANFDLNLRTLDALHIAVAKSADLQLITADELMAKAARVLGVDVQLLQPRKRR